MASDIQTVMSYVYNMMTTNYIVPGITVWTAFIFFWVLAIVVGVVRNLLFYTIDGIADDWQDSEDFKMWGKWGE